MRLSREQENDLYEKGATVGLRVVLTNPATPSSPPPSRSSSPTPPPNKHRLRKLRYRNEPLFRTPAGDVVGRGHTGPKKKIADSRKEYRRLLELVALRDAGAIEFLRAQVRFKLHGPNGTPICAYVADFVYVVRGRRVVEDVKSRITKMDKVYRLKRAWLLDEYGIEIIET